MSDAAVAMRYLAPQIIVALTGVLVIVVDLVWPRRDSDSRSRSAPLAYLGVFGLAMAAVMTVVRGEPAEALLWGTFVIDALAVYFDLLFLGIAIVVIVVSIDALPDLTPSHAEFYALVIWCTLGNMLLAPVADLFTLFLCFQLTSLPLIALMGVDLSDPRHREAALKYLVIVLVSTALFLYGLSLVYGAFGTSDMAAIGAQLTTQPPTPLAIVGFVLLLTGFGFKTTTAPFQFWVPDVYEGTSTPVTAFLSVGSKLAGFALILRFVVTGLNANPELHLIFAVLAVLSMLLGNLGALQQSNIKRLLAYSGIAQAGYILVGLAAMSVTGMSALLFYLAAYAVANLLAFTVVIVFSKAVGSEDIADYAGLVRRSPIAAFSLTVALMSLAGLPLTAGFMAKFYVFLSAAQAGLIWLVLIAVVNAVMAFYYYLRIVWALYVDENEAETFHASPRHTAVMVVCTAGVVVIGVLPAPLLNAASHAAAALFGL